MKKHLWLMGLLVAQFSFGAVCKTVTGKVTYNGKPLAAGEVLDMKGDVVAEADSKAVIEIVDGNDKAEVCVTAGSTLSLDPKTAFEVNVVSGSVRARLKAKSHKKVFSLRTPSSVMAVRGTDFMGTFGTLLNESEIVVFDGTVKFSSVNGKDSKNIKKGYWGGIGGRYGKKIGELIKLPKNVLEHFDTTTAF